VRTAKQQKTTTQFKKVKRTKKSKETYM